MTPQKPRWLFSLTCILPLLAGGFSAANAQVPIVINANTEIADLESFGSGPVLWETGYIGTTAESLILPNPISFGPTGNLRTHGFLFGGTMTLSGPMDLGGLTRTLNGAPNKTTLAGPISNGGLRLSGGRWLLQGNQPFAGGLTAINAFLEVDDPLSLGAPGVTATFEGTRLIPLSPLTIDRPIAVGVWGLAMDTTIYPVTISGNVSRYGASAFLANSGPGTLTITSDTFQGVDIEVRGGLVKLNNAAGAPHGRVLNGGTLGGIGRIGYTQVEEGGRISPGDGGPGTFTLRSGLLLHGGAILDFDLGTAAFDQIRFTHGNPDVLADPGERIIVNIFDSGGLDEDQSYTLLDWTDATPGPLFAADFELGSSPIHGHFEVVESTLRFVTVPEPSFGALVSCALLGLSARRLRRGVGAELR